MNKNSQKITTVSIFPSDEIMVYRNHKLHRYQFNIYRAARVRRVIVSTQNFVCHVNMWDDTFTRRDGK
jgi:hypothetical protein